MPKSINDARFWDRIARKYAADLITDMDGYERSLEATKSYLGSKVIAYEFGCGTGTTVLKLAPSLAHILATDFSSEMITIAKEKAEAQGIANVSFEVGMAEAVYPDEAFDIALGFNVLHLLKARTEVLRGIHRLLKPGGFFISKTPCLNEMNFLIRLAIPVMQLVGRAPYVSFFSAEKLAKEIEAEGFEIIENARHGTKGKDTKSFIVARKI